LLWIAENQLGRRNLTDGKRKVIAAMAQKLRANLNKVTRAETAREAKAGKSVPSETDATEKAAKNVETATAVRTGKTNKAAETSATKKSERESRTAVAKEYGVSVNGLREAASLTPETPAPGTAHPAAPASRVAAVA
jgi:hypothetical protein